MPDYDPLYWQMRRENDQFLRRQRWWWFHRLNGSLRSQRQRQAEELSRQAEKKTAKFLRAQGYQVNFTTRKAPFDLWVADDQGRSASVEVKISLLHQNKAGNRYQATISPAEIIWADLVIFIARNGQDWPYVIPMRAIKPRRNIAIWTACPADYRGQWARYLQAWHHLEQAIITSPPRAWQLSLAM